MLVFLDSIIADYRAQINQILLYLRTNRSFVKDVKQDRRRKSVSNASVEAARKEKNHLKKITRRRGSTPQDKRAFYGTIRSHSCLKRIHEQAQRDNDATFQEWS
jgi:uncharacterized membrane protein YgaE (UPF0421/DUF939 family)